MAVGQTFSGHMYTTFLSLPTQFTQSRQFDLVPGIRRAGVVDESTLSIVEIVKDYIIVERYRMIQTYDIVERYTPAGIIMCEVLCALL